MSKIFLCGRFESASNIDERPKLSDFLLVSLVSLLQSLNFLLLLSEQLSLVFRLFQQLSIVVLECSVSVLNEGDLSVSATQCRGGF